MSTSNRSDDAIRDGHGRKVAVLELESLEELPTALPVDSPFVVMVASHSASVSGPLLMTFAKQLLSAGCVYAVCWGSGCSDMEDAFDYADIDLNPNFDDDDLVITTSHADQSLDEALWFASECAFPAQRYQASCESMLVIVVPPAATSGEVHRFFASAPHSAA